MTPPLATSFDAAENSAGLLLWRVTNRWQAEIRKALKPYGLTHVQFVLLASLSWLGSEGPVTQRELADHAATDPMMTSQVLRALEQRGLVVRRDHPDDARAKAVAVTKDGAALADRTVAVVEACDDAFFGTLGSTSARFRQGLARLAAAG